MVGQAGSGSVMRGRSSAQGSTMRRYNRWNIYPRTSGEPVFSVSTDRFTILLQRYIYIALVSSPVMSSGVTITFEPTQKFWACPKEKHKHLTFDSMTNNHFNIKTKLVQHVPRMNISIWHLTHNLEVYLPQPAFLLQQISTNQSPTTSLSQNPIIVTRNGHFCRCVRQTQVRHRLYNQPVFLKKLKSIETTWSTVT